jgi:hypothetical protein
MSRNAVLVVLTLMISAASAGGSEAQQTEVGVWGGIARTNEITSTILCTLDCGPSSFWNHYWRHTATGGVTVRRPVGARLAARAEISLAPKGYGPGTTPHDGRVASRYLELPLLIDVRLLKLGPAEIQLSAGLAPAVLLACTVSGTTVEGFVETGCGERDPRTGGSSGPGIAWDVGLVIAPGMRVPAGPAQLTVEARHTRGLVDIRPGSGGSTTNRATALAVGTALMLPGRR